MKKIGVIFGGMSTEHEVSISSGTSIISNLDKQKYEILPIYISKSGEWYKYTKPVNDIIPLHVGDEITELEKIENEFECLKKFGHSISCITWFVWRGWNNPRIIRIIKN